MEDRGSRIVLAVLRREVRLGVADEAPDDRRDRGEELDDDLQRLAHAREAVFGHEDRGAQPHGHRERPGPTHIASSE